MKRIDNKIIRRARRKQRIRKKVSGTGERPRMSVYKSNKHIYVQVIDDQAGNTIASASTIEKETKGSILRSVQGGEQLGELIGKRLIEKNVKTIIFDRNCYPYHGIVKAVAEGARKAGIEF